MREGKLPTGDAKLAADPAAGVKLDGDAKSGVSILSLASSKTATS